MASLPAVAASLLHKLTGYKSDNTLGSEAPDGSGPDECYDGASYWHPDENLH